MATKKKGKKKEQQKQQQPPTKEEEQQKQKDDIIDYSILDHQEELLDERYIPIIRNAMRRIPFDVIDTIASDRNVRFFTITDESFAVVKNLIDPYGAIPPEKRGLTHLTICNSL